MSPSPGENGDRRLWGIRDAIPIRALHLAVDGCIRRSGVDRIKATVWMVTSAHCGLCKGCLLRSFVLMLFILRHDITLVQIFSLHSTVQT